MREEALLIAEAEGVNFIDWDNLKFKPNFILKYKVLA
jgi:hypothetical protein